MLKYYAVASGFNSEFWHGTCGGEPAVSSKQTSWNRRELRLFIFARRSQASTGNNRPRSLRSEQQAFVEQRMLARKIQGNLHSELCKAEEEQQTYFEIVSGVRLDAEEVDYFTTVYEGALYGHWQVTAVEQIDDQGHQGWIFKKIL